MCRNLQIYTAFRQIAFSLVFIAGLMIPICASAYDFTPNLQKAYSEIFSLRVQAGRQLLATESPSNPFRIYVENYADMVELLNSEDAAAYDKLSRMENQRLTLIEKTDKQSPYNRFLRAELKIHWALLKIRFGHEIKAAWNIIQANRLLEENRRLFPKFLPQLKSIGCLHVLVGSIPESQQWVTGFLGLKGNIQQGMSELEAASHDKIWGTEADFCRLFIQAYILPYNDHANRELLKSIAQHRNNLNLNYLATAISLKTGQTAQAVQIQSQSPYDPSYLYFHVADLYKGEVNLFRENYSDAAESYLAYIQHFKGKAFLKDTYYKLFLCSWLGGDEKKAISYLNRIPSVGNTIAESDKAAQKFYENYNKTRVLPHQSLVRIRLAFDAGYYDEALTIAQKLREQDFGSDKDKADFNYRLARIYQKTSQPDKALSYYARAIRLTDLNNDAQWHFGASSALQSGYIYQEKNQKPKAADYFEKALAYKRHEYKTSVDNKARAALTAMGK